MKKSLKTIRREISESDISFWAGVAQLVLACWKNRSNLAEFIVLMLGIFIVGPLMMLAAAIGGKENE